MTDTDFDLDDEPVLTAEGEVAAAPTLTNIQPGPPNGGRSVVSTVIQTSRHLSFVPFDGSVTPYI